MEHPSAIRPEQHAVFKTGKMGKSTIFRSERILVGLNAFEPGLELAGVVRQTERRFLSRNGGGEDQSNEQMAKSRSHRSIVGNARAGRVRLHPTSAR